MHADTHRVLSFPPARPSQQDPWVDAALLGPSPAMARVWSQMRRIAPHFRAALLVGEPGTGAEAAARAMHALSPVSHLPFHIVEPSLADSIFSNPEVPCEGLLFLIDVEHLSPSAQRALLRKFRLRGRSPFRVVACSSAELRACVSAGRFLAELADVLSTVRIALPPLRERVEDLPLIARHLLQTAADRLSMVAPLPAPDFHAACAASPWPGNLPQLQHVISNLLTASHTGTLTAADFEAAIAGTLQSQPSQAAPVRMVPLDEIVQEHIRAVLIGCDGNKLRASEVLGISRSTLYRMLDGAVANRHFPLAI